MDRRMYRGNMGCNRTVLPYKTNNPVCSDIVSKNTEEKQERGYEGNLDRYPIGMCYVPWQRFRNLYENEFAALAHGTIFKELDLEFYGRSCK